MIGAVIVVVVAVVVMVVVVAMVVVVVATKERFSGPYNWFISGPTDLRGPRDACGTSEVGGLLRVHGRFSWMPK